VQLKLEERVAKAKAKRAAKIVLLDDPIESLDDKEEHKEVFTLGCMGTRSQTRVNRYYTADEAEEGLDVDENNQESMEVVVDGNSDVDEPSEFDPSDDEEYNESVDGDSDIMDESM
jgi:hypothetical protein